MNKSEFAVSIFNKMAKEYQDKFMDVNLYADVLDFFCEQLSTANAQVLELACGPGNISHYLLNKRPDVQLLGIDLAPNMVELARANNPQAEFRVMDCRHITTLHKQFDGIVCGFCLPYLAKEETTALIADAAQLLMPGGLIYLSTMEDDNEKSGYRKSSKGDEIYIHYYLADDITAMLQQHSLNLIHLSRKSYQAADGSPVVDVMIIAQKAN